MFTYQTAIISAEILSIGLLTTMNYLCDPKLKGIILPGRREEERTETYILCKAEQMACEKRNESDLEKTRKEEGRQENT